MEEMTQLSFIWKSIAQIYLILKAPFKLSNVHKTLNVQKLYSLLCYLLFFGSNLSPKLRLLLQFSLGETCSEQCDLCVLTCCHLLLDPKDHYSVSPAGLPQGHMTNCHGQQTSAARKFRHTTLNLRIALIELFAVQCHRGSVCMMDTPTYTAM